MRMASLSSLSILKSFPSFMVLSNPTAEAAPPPSVESSKKRSAEALALAPMVSTLSIVVSDSHVDAKAQSIGMPPNRSKKNQLRTYLLAMIRWDVTTSISSSTKAMKKFNARSTRKVTSMENSIHRQMKSPRGE